MPARIFAPLVLCALVFTGCDIIDEVQPEPAIPVTISAVEISDLRQRPWDPEDGTGPDIFVEIQDPGGGTYARSATVQDADLSQTYTLTFPEGFEVATLTSNMFVTVFDQDSDTRVDAQIVGSSQPFTAADVNAAQDSLLLLDFDVDDGRAATYTLIK